MVERDRPPNADGVVGLARRQFLRATAVTPVAGLAGAVPTDDDEHRILVEQDDACVAVRPLGSGAVPVEDVLGDGAATESGFEAPGTSRLFFWSGPEGLNLVVLHGAQGDDGGAATLAFEGLPLGIPEGIEPLRASETQATDQTVGGRWVVRNDRDDFGSDLDPAPEWEWSETDNDGGAFRGGLDEEFQITVDPDFGAGDGTEPAIQSWEVLSGDDGVEAHCLEPDEAVVLRTGSPRIPAVLTQDLPTAAEIDAPLTPTVTVRGRCADPENLDLRVEVEEGKRRDVPFDPQFEGDYAVSVELVGSVGSRGALADVERDNCDPTNYRLRALLPTPREMTPQSVAPAGADDPASAAARGAGFRINVEAVYEGPTEDHVLLDRTFRTFAFEHVNEVTYFPGKPRDTVGPPDVVNEALFDRLREQAERINELWASGLGTMGAHGMEFDFATDVAAELVTDAPVGQDFDGWLELPYDVAGYTEQVATEELRRDTDGDGEEEQVASARVFEYGRENFVTRGSGEDRPYFASDEDEYLFVGEDDDPGIREDQGSIGTQRPGFAAMTHALYLAHRHPALDFSVAPADKPPMSPLPSEDALPTAMFGYSKHLAETQPLSGRAGRYSRPFYPNRSTVIAAADGNPWLHELGHRLGLPDLYWGPGRPITRVIGAWGPMGGGEVYTAYSRAFQGKLPEAHGGDNWLESSRVDLERDESTTLELEPLTDLEFGDTIEYLRSGLKEYVVEEHYRRKLPEGKFRFFSRLLPEHELTSYFVLEARRADPTYVRHPHIDDTDETFDEAETDDPVPRSPDPEGNDGVAVYSAGTLDPADHAEDQFKDVLQYRPPTHDPIDVKEDQRTRVTLADGPSLDLPVVPRDAFYDERAATLFELVESDFESGDVAVRVERTEDPEIRSDSPVEKLVTVVVEVVDDLLDGLTGGGNGDGAVPARALPRLDVLAVTEDGRRIGTDPETGEALTEVDGARVSGSLGDLRVTIPGEAFEDLASVTVSTARLEDGLDELGVDTPDEFTYDRTTIVETRPDVVERDGVAYIDGRQKQRTTTTVGGGAGVGVAAMGERFDLAAVPADVDVDPDRINTRSRGRWVTAYLTLDGSVDAADVVLRTVSLKSVQAVTDEQFGFVEDPVVDETDDEQTIQAKFPRDEVVAALGTGTHEVAVSGMFGDTSFVGWDTVDVFHPGPPDDVPGEGRGGNDPPSGEHGDGRGGGP